MATDKGTVAHVCEALEGAGADTEELARRLFAESEGLPFIVAEYLNLLAGASPRGIMALTRAARVVAFGTVVLVIRRP